MSNCTDCLLDLTDACPRGSGRAIDDEMCDAFFPREKMNDNPKDEASNVILSDFMKGANL